MLIGGFQSTTLLDYPGHLACTVFTQGCNFRCPFCQNGSLVLPEKFDPPFSEEDILTRIKKRSVIYEGVCVSGGEPTNQPDLSEFLKKIKNMGLLVKLDSNGTRPEVLKQLNEESLIDMIAMDIKAAPAQFAEVCGLKENNSLAKKILEKTTESIEFIMSCGIEYEFRTTLVKGLHDISQSGAMASQISGAKAYFLQSYTDSDLIINKLKGNKKQFESFSETELNEILSEVKKYVPSACLRGID
ncbi:MAG: anaerobic ribonucleoside-triphosphate reductase activating protein [Lachnospiraceae bacterium]|nr:anaerobic ribonucleoside-triphosphate reductase activating protein [Lachnospiraceae bacterium]